MEKSHIRSRTSQAGELHKQNRHIKKTWHIASSTYKNTTIFAHDRLIKRVGSEGSSQPISLVPSSSKFASPTPYNSDKIDLKSSVFDVVSRF